MSIAKHASGYPRTTQELYNSSKYAGHPLDPNVDEAWRLLLRPMDIRVTAAELARNNRTSVQLPRDRGYLAWLGVFHELHCLTGLKFAYKIMQKLLRQWKYKEQYFPNMTSAQAYDMDSHTGMMPTTTRNMSRTYEILDHCLDRIRATIICHPDIASLTTFFWGSGTKPTVDGTKTLHSCVDWDVLMDSIMGRAVSSEEVDTLVNPSL
ncbi:hypothetical protein HO133_007185 [Letharia lupina]|uniref:Uncharacterized protein n=1 Tax=Letharia lupina TaxID=560253 RepID=A0A8H6FID3_9LECA|nr:uncharacterized protein HO133_007185 [Letharia lupina]KAF6229071.1 hypothetical protein HO133_007185 [Letharia lupina]